MPTKERVAGWFRALPLLARGATAVTPRHPRLNQTHQGDEGRTKAGRAP